MHIPLPLLFLALLLFGGLAGRATFASTNIAKIGHGKIFVFEIGQTIGIRTGEIDENVF